MATTAIICSKNEERSIGEVIEQTKPYVDEILVIDGHSTDGTAEIVRSLGCTVIEDDGRGKGSAVRLGLLRCKGEYAVLLDADGSHNPEDIPKLLEPLKSGIADLVIASRALGGSEELDGSVESFFRNMFGNHITTYINLRFRTKLTDSQNGFRAVRTNIVPSLKLSENSFTIEQQMVIRCLKRGFKIVEIPSMERKREHGISHISIRRHGPLYFWCLLREVFTR